jgi:hypothetical protein
MPLKPQDPNGRASASAEDLDESLRGQDAAQAETDRIESWTKPNFAGAGRQQSQTDPSFGYRERK